MACRRFAAANLVYRTPANGQVRTVNRLWRICALALALLAPSAKAELPKPKGQVLLTISGQIRETNINGQAAFDREMLENMGMVAFETETPWTEGQVEFAGVPFDRLLDSVAPAGSIAKARAANDYSADIPLPTLRETGAILAMRLNGENMTLRDKGPLWIVFPWSQNPDLKHVEMYNCSVWQLVSLHIQ